MSNDFPGGGTSTPPPPPPYGTQPPRQLKRRPKEGHIGGVCAGVAHYFAVDPVIVRIAAAVLILSGPGILAYILAWIFVPEASDEEQRQGPGPNPTLPFRLDRSGQVFGVVLLSLSIIFLWGGWWSPVRRWGFPLALLGLGLWLIFRKRDDGADQPWPSAGDAEPSWPSSPPVGAEPDGGESGADGGAGDDPTTVYGSGAGEAPTGEQPPWSYAYSYQYGHGGNPLDPKFAEHLRHRHRREHRPLTDEERAARRRRRMVFPTVMGALLVWTGMAFLFGVGLQASLAVALCIVGVGFVLGALVGGGKILILPALLLGAALVATSVLDLPLEGPMGKRHREVVKLADLDDPLQVSMGEQIIDVTGLDFAGEDEVTLVASVGIGHLQIEVPDDVDLQVRATAEAGELKILGVTNSGVGVESNRNVDMGASDRLLVLDLEVGLGAVEVISVPSRAGSTTATTATTLG